VLARVILLLFTALVALAGPAAGAEPLKRHSVGDGVFVELRAVTRGTEIRDSVVTIGGEAAIRLSYRLRLTAAGKTFIVQTLQHAFLRSGKSVGFTYTTLPRYAGTYAATFKASAQSIRLA
jgi:hypothetical protein